MTLINGDGHARRGQGRATLCSQSVMDRNAAACGFGIGKAAMWGRIMGRTTASAAPVTLPTRTGECQRPSAWRAAIEFLPFYGPKGRNDRMLADARRTDRSVGVNATKWQSMPKAGSHRPWSDATRRSCPTAARMWGRCEFGHGQPKRSALSARGVTRILLFRHDYWFDRKTNCASPNDNKRGPATNWEAAPALGCGAGARVTSSYPLSAS